MRTKRLPLLIILIIGALFLAASTLGCATGCLSKDETGTRREAIDVGERPKAQEMGTQHRAGLTTTVTNLEQTVQERQRGIEQNEAMLERQKQEIQRLRLRKSEYQAEYLERSLG